ncbi:hypothetical protein SDC9_158890 [bioreactor metagenome]|uniref:Uncharacterized protein n=1 Tax=bioreactor metagenome TaxID=1076179 RepID=A0A645FBF1_9ZZZZ
MDREINAHELLAACDILYRLSLLALLHKPEKIHGLFFTEDPVPVFYDIYPFHIKYMT